MFVTRYQPLIQTEELLFSFPGCSFSRMKSQFLFSTASLWSFSLLEKKNKRGKGKKVGVSWFPSKCKPSPAPVFTRRTADPRWATRATVAGRCLKAKVFSRCVNTHTHMLTHTKRNRLRSFLILYDNMLRGGGWSCWTMAPCSCYQAPESPNTDRRAGWGWGPGEADLMRGMLSSVQHRSGPLCKDSSSSHDWLYNLQRQTWDKLSHESQQDSGWLQSSSNASLLPHLPSGADSSLCCYLWWCW